MFKPERISKLCEERKMTRRALCDLSGITTATLNRVTDHGSDIGVVKLDRIAHALKVPVSYFFDSDFESCDYDKEGNKMMLRDSVGKSKADIEKMTDAELIKIIKGETTEDEFKVIPRLTEGEEATASDSQLLSYYKSLLEEKERTIQLLLKIQGISLPTVTPFKK